MMSSPRGEIYSEELMVQLIETMLRGSRSSQRRETKCGTLINRSAYTPGDRGFTRSAEPWRTEIRFRILGF